MYRMVLFVIACGALTFCQAADDFKPEAGFTLIFNGQDFSGWKIAAYKDKDKGGEAVGAKTEAGNKRFIVVDGAIVIDGKAKGDMILMSEKSFEKDVHIKFDFKPNKACNNDLIFRGMKFDIKPSDIKNAKVDDWNTFEIIITGTKAEFKCNGELIKSMAAKASPGSFGVRAEGGGIEIRRIRVKE